MDTILCVLMFVFSYVSFDQKTYMHICSFQINTVYDKNINKFDIIHFVCSDAPFKKMYIIKKL